MIYKLYKILIYIVISTVLTNQALSETKLLGTEKYWKAYSTKLDKAKTCFITSEPIKTEGNFNKGNRGKPFVFVTNTKGFPLFALLNLPSVFIGSDIIKQVLALSNLVE